MQERNRRYLLRDNLFLAVNGSLSRLCRILWSRRSPFALREPSVHAWLRRVPTAVLLPLRVLRVVLAVLRARFGFRDCSLLPIKADLAIHCRPDGYKYFDFRAKRVIVGVGVGVEREAFEHHVQLLGLIGAAGVGPRIGDPVGYSGTVYEEELVEGERVRSVLEEWDRIEDPLAEFLTRLFRVPGRRTVNLENCRMELSRRWRAARGAFPKPDRSDGRLDTLDACWSRHCARLAGANSGKISIGLTHGDFREKNFSLVDGRIVAIDWVTIGERCGLYDLYSILFTALLYVPEDDENTRNRVYRLLGAMHSRLSADLMKNNDGRPAPDEWNGRSSLFSIFVLEFLLTRLSHFVIPYGADSEFGGRMLDQLLRYISEFERFREYSAESRNVSRPDHVSALCVV